MSTFNNPRSLRSVRAKQTTQQHRPAPEPPRAPAKDPKPAKLTAKQAASAEVDRLYWIYFDTPKGSPHEARAEADWMAALIKWQDL